MAYFFTKLLGRYSKRAKALTGGDPAAIRLYSDRVLASPVESLLDPSLFARPTDPDVIDLNQSAPRFESPVSAGRLTADRLGPPPAWGVPDLREAVATRYGFDADNVLVTRGASGAFAAVLDAFVNPGDRVVLTDPGPPLFAIGAASRRAAVGWVPEACDATAFHRAVSGAKLVAIATPNNPTGRLLTEDVLAERIDLATRAGAVVYLDGTFDPDRKLPMGKRVLVGGSISAFGLSGLRVGWLAGPPGLIRPCALAQALAGPFVPAVCQQVAARTVSERDPALSETVAARRRWAADRLTRAGLATDPDGSGYFLWVNVSATGLTGRQFADRLFAESRVIVGPGDQFGPSGTNNVRVSVAADDGRVREGLARTASFVATLTGKPEVASAQVRVEEAAEERPAAFSRV